VDVIASMVWLARYERYARTIELRAFEDGRIFAALIHCLVRLPTLLDI
jgi:hypothetical protein